MRMMSLHRPSARLVRHLLLLAGPLLVVLTATPTLGAFSAAIAGNGHSTAASLVLSSSPSGGATCYSTGAASAPFSADSASCGGSIWPASELSTSSSSLETTFATVGTVAPSSTTLASSSSGLLAEPDASANGNYAFGIGGVGFGQAGPLSALATSFNGSSGRLESSNLVVSPDTFSLVAWFEAPSHSTGGGIIGFDNAQNGAGSSHDRTIWMDNSGKIVAGISGSANPEATSSSTYDNGAWHLVVAVFTPSTLTLYVDGSQVASVTSGITEANYTGYWSVGYTESSGRTDPPSSDYWDGSLADVAVVPSALSAATDTTIYGEASQTALEAELSSLSPSALWPLQQTATTTDLPVLASLPDISANNNLATPQGGVTPSEQGPFGSDGAMYFDGESSAKVETTTSNAALGASWTVAAWFKAPSELATGGSIVSFDTAQAGGGSGHDPLLWMSNAGKIVVGTYAGGQQEAKSASAYNNNAWHFVVATVSSAAGLKLYVDGSLVASNASGTTGGTLGGYWIIGYGDDGGWTEGPTNTNWTGELAHVAYFGSALSATQVSELYADKSAGVATFESALLAASPTYYWPLTDSGTTESRNYPFFQVEPDASANNDDATVGGSTVTLGVPGPYSSSAAAAFTGGSGLLETARTYTNPQGFSVVAYFKAPSHSTGGGIFHFNERQAGGEGGARDRMLWMDNAGKLVIGTYPVSSSVEATTTSTYDNGAWHVAVAVFSSTAIKLYVDGSEVASAAVADDGTNYTGYWVIGRAVGWTDNPTDEYWTGSLADVAVIPSAISAATDTTIVAESSQSALESELLSLTPTAYWPLAESASAPADAGAVEMSAQAANNGTTTCLFPAGAGICPGLTASDLVPKAHTWAPTAPTAAHATTATLSAQEASTAPAPFAGLHFAIPLTFSGTAGSSWTAALNYPAANVEL